MISMCCVCKSKLKVASGWADIGRENGEYLEKQAIKPNAKLQISHSYCPECKHEAEKQLLDVENAAICPHVHCEIIEHCALINEYKNCTVYQEVKDEREKSQA